MQVIEVNTPLLRKEFHEFTRRLYRNDRNWICPLDSVIEDIFDPTVNHRFENGKAIRWILKNDKNQTIGRIAAFIDYTRSSASRQPTGGLGFFEVIDSREAAFALFDTAKSWLSSLGMQAMDGPINFGENYDYWGLLVEGFTRQGFGMPYNKPYYRDFFEDYGFNNYFEQYTCHRNLRNQKDNPILFPERVMKVAEWLTKRPGYSFRSFDINNPEAQITDICTIYNETWTFLKNDFTPLEPAILFESFQKLKHFIDPDLICFAYYNDKPIGFFVLVPDFNQILRHFNGKIGVMGVLKVWYYKLTHEMTRIEAIVGGVHHSHHNKGVEAGIFYKLYEAFKRKPWFKELEIGWVGDYNPRMIATYESLEAVRVKTHVTYRYMINRNLRFVRFKDEIAVNQTIENDTSA